MMLGGRTRLSKKEWASVRDRASRNAEASRVARRAVAAVQRMGPPAVIARALGPAAPVGRREEVKSIDNGNAMTPAHGTAALNTTGSVFPLNIVAQGSAQYERVGNKIDMRSLELSYTLQPIAAARSCAMDSARILVVYDKQTNGAAPAISDILQDADQAGDPFTNTFSGLNILNSDRFIVLYDRRVQLPALTTQVAAPSVTAEFPSGFGGDLLGKGDGLGFHHRFLRFRGLPTQFKANGGSVGDISTGGVFLVTLGATAAGSECWAIPKWHARLRYSD